MSRTTELYLENGQKASLEDVCKWWIEIYPADVFVNKPKPIVEARMCMQNILIMCEKNELIRGKRRSKKCDCIDYYNKKHSNGKDNVPIEEEDAH